MDDSRDGVTSMPCPYCGYLLDAATDARASGARPKPGDVSICFGCAGLLVFDERGAVRLPTDDEVAAIGQDPEVRFARQFVMAAIGRRGH